MTKYLPVLPNSALTFDDEFNTFTSSSNGSRGWMTTYPYGGKSARTLPNNHEAEYYADPSVGENPFSDSGGVLTITAKPAVAGSNPDGLPYDSGVITTYKSFSQKYGIFEVRAELPAGAGLWPAFWMLPASNVVSAELDIFEVIGQQPGTLYFTTHGSTSGKWSSDLQALQVANTSTGYHTYAVDWEPKTVTLYIDGIAIAAAPTPSSMDSPMYMLLNLAVGGAKSWPGRPTSGSEFPASMKIDYVRAYATAATADVGGTAAIKGVTPLSVQAAPILLGTGSDKLVLGISETAWKGNVEFTLSVDGKQIGGVLTTTALQGEGQVQSFTIEGNWGPGQHKVGIDFLNDAYGGTARTDRNLFVDSASYDGNASGGVALYSDGTKTMTAVSATTYSPGAADRAITSLGDDTIIGGSGTLSVTASGPKTSITLGSGKATISALAGTDTVTGGTGRLTFILGDATANVTLGRGAATFDITDGAAGGSLSVHDFVPGTDTIHLSDYKGSGIASETTNAAATTIVLTDHTKIMLFGVARGESVFT